MFVRKSKLTYDVARDFGSITMAVTYPYLLAAHPSAPAKTAAEFVAHMKSETAKWASVVKAANIQPQ